MKPLSRSIALSILLGSLLGFSGCSSSSDAESNPAYNVQAMGMFYGSELSIYAYIVNQDDELSTNAMITVNGEPMNIGFYAEEDANADEQDSFTGMNVTTDVQGVPCTGYLPYYFFESDDLNVGDTVKLLATGRNQTTLFSSATEIPEELTLLEPSPDATVNQGQEVYVRWQGGAPFDCFRLTYFGGSSGEQFETEWTEHMYEYTLPADVIESGYMFLEVAACPCEDIPSDDDHTSSSSNAVIQIVGISTWPVPGGTSLVTMTTGSTAENHLDACKQQAHFAIRMRLGRCDRETSASSRVRCRKGWRDRETRAIKACNYKFCPNPIVTCR